MTEQQQVLWETLAEPFPLPPSAQLNQKGNLLWNGPDGMPYWVPSTAVFNGQVLVKPRVCNSCLEKRRAGIAPAAPASVPPAALGRPGRPATLDDVRRAFVQQIERNNECPTCNLDSQKLPEDPPWVLLAIPAAIAFAYLALSAIAGSRPKAPQA